MSNEEGVVSKCPKCGEQISVSDNKCYECGLDMDEWMTDENIEKLLSQVDDDTLELKTDDQDSIVDKIKQFAYKKEPTEDEVIYECPICEMEVSEDDDSCPGCGVLFEK